MILNVAIIPARGGSKGLPRKNLKIFKGKPLIAWTIEAALEAKYIDCVIVTTDDQEIADVSKKWGAEVPFLRPESLAQDDSKVFDAIKYTIDRYKKENTLEVGNIIILQPTSPLRMTKHIDEAFDRFNRSGMSALISVTKNEHPVHWTKIINEKGLLENLFKDIVPGNRQSHLVTYIPNGMIYIYRYKDFLEKEGEFEKVVSYVIERKYSVDIDDIYDFKYAEVLYDSLMNLFENAKG